MTGSLENAPPHAMEEPELTQGQSRLKKYMTDTAILMAIREYSIVTQRPAQVKAGI